MSMLRMPDAAVLTLTALTYPATTTPVSALEDMLATDLTAQVKLVKQLEDIALLKKSSQSYEASLDMGSHSATCHPTQVNTPA